MKSLRLNYRSKLLYAVRFENNGMFPNLDKILSYNKFGRKLSRQIIEQLITRGYCILSLRASVAEYLIDFEFKSKMTRNEHEYGIYKQLYDSSHNIIREHNINMLL